MNPIHSLCSILAEATMIEFDKSAVGLVHKKEIK